MNTIQFRKLLDLIMCCDPWPVTNDSDNQTIIKTLANEEAKNRGFSGWVDAYHGLDND